MQLEVPGGSPDEHGFVYDEFSYFDENCAEYEIDCPADLVVERESIELPDGRSMSALRWGTGSPTLVLLHGGAQNAHTWDTLALALWPTSVLAVDLPGHGWSSWREDGAYDPRSNADDVAVVLERLAPAASLVVGMSLGGLTATALAARRPDLVAQLLLVDVTPGVDREKAAAVHAFIEGPQTFGSFAEIFERTVQFNPTRSGESLRRGILHNAHRQSDGTWQWNYDRGIARPGRSPVVAGDEDEMSTVLSELWDDVSALAMPVTLVRGGLSPVVDDADIAEFLRRQPGAEVTVVEGAGHSIQGDRPLELAELLRTRLR